MNLIDSVLPHGDVAKVLIQKSQVEGLVSLVSQNVHVFFFPFFFHEPTEYASAPHGWLMNGDPAM